MQSKFATRATDEDALSSVAGAEKPPHLQFTKMQLRYRLPRRQKLHISPLIILSNTAEADLSHSAAEVTEEVSCNSSVASVSNHKAPPLPPANFRYELRRLATRSYYWNEISKFDEPLEVSDNSCVESCSGANGVRELFKLKSATVESEAEGGGGEVSKSELCRSTSSLAPCAKEFNQATTNKLQIAGIPCLALTPKNEDKQPYYFGKEKVQDLPQGDDDPRWDSPPLPQREELPEEEEDEDNDGNNEEEEDEDNDGNNEEEENEVNDGNNDGNNDEYEQYVCAHCSIYGRVIEFSIIKPKYSTKYGTYCFRGMDNVDEGVTETVRGVTRTVLTCRGGCGQDVGTHILSLEEDEDEIEMEEEEDEMEMEEDEDEMEMEEDEDEMEMEEDDDDDDGVKDEDGDEMEMEDEDRVGMEDEDRVGLEDEESEEEEKIEDIFCLYEGSLMVYEHGEFTAYW